MKTDLAALENEVATLLVGPALRAKAAAESRRPPTGVLERKIATLRAKHDEGQHTPDAGAAAERDLDVVFAALWGILFDKGLVSHAGQKAYDKIAKNVCGKVLRETGYDAYGFI